MIASRLKKVRRKMSEQNLDALLISQAENRRYLSGFDGSYGHLLLTDKKSVLCTDFRYEEQAKIQAPDYEIFRTTTHTPDWLSPFITDLKINRLGFEADAITFNTYRAFSDTLSKAQPRCKLVPTTKMVESMRAIKEAEEIEFITRAVEISDKAMDYARDTVSQGMTEKEASWEIERFLRENGSQTLPFDIIVASGPNSAKPHARPSERRIGSGEPVIIDIGARVNGYGSDLTRTFCLGTPDSTFKKVYDIVLGAQLSALAMIKEGMSGHETDNLTRTVIDEAGYKETFGHALGHGVGLAPHEIPRLGANSTDELVSGMTFTIEPGIYLPGWGGVRIEDIAIMESGTVKFLSKAIK